MTQVKRIFKIKYTPKKVDIAGMKFDLMLNEEYSLRQCYDAINKKLFFGRGEKNLI